MPPEVPSKHQPQMIEDEIVNRRTGLVEPLERNNHKLNGAASFFAAVLLNATESITNHLRFAVVTIDKMRFGWIWCRLAFTGIVQCCQ
jgi:hypothetical protein